MGGRGVSKGRPDARLQDAARASGAVLGGWLPSQNASIRSASRPRSIKIALLAGDKVCPGCSKAWAGRRPAVQADRIRRRRRHDAFDPVRIDGRGADLVP